MKNVNIGIVNLMVSSKLNESYFDKESINESRELTSEFFSVVKSSPVLQLEFKVFSNIEGKHIENEVSATRYIDNNVKLFEIYTVEEIDAERDKLKKFIGEAKAPVNDKVKLYEAIDDLIYESIADYNDIDVNKMHESFSLVLEHVQTEKIVPETTDSQPINEEIIQIAVEKFNKKYSTMNEEDRTLLQTLIKSDDAQREELLETYKTDSLAILEGVNKDNTKDSITKAILKIKEMAFNKKTANNDIIGLHELKRGLI